MLRKLTMVVALLSISVVTERTASAQARKGFMMAAGSESQLLGDVLQLAAEGAKIVRIPIYLNYTTLERGIDLVESVMPFTTTHGITVVVDFHCPNRGKGTFVVEKPDQFVRDWGQIATRLKKYGAQSVWYELGNEQEDTPASTWRNLATRTAKAIRAVDATHPICYSPTGVTTSPAATMRKLEGISGPQILTFHFYNWQTRPAVQGLTGIAEYPSPLRMKSDLQRLLLEVQAAGRREGVPVYVSEVCIRRDHPNAPRFLRDLTETCETLGIHLTLHAYREFSAWNYEGTSAWPVLQAWLRRK